MRLDINIPDRLGAHAIDAALEGLVQVAQNELMHPEVAGAFPTLYTSGVRYERERGGTEHWLLPSQTYAAGRGDCEDLASWRAAELRVTGEDEGARARVIRSGPRTWHAVVERSDGRIEDPSRALGMGTEEQHTLGAMPDWTFTVTRRGGVWLAELSRGDAGVSGRAPYAHDAIAQAAEVGYVLGELGQIPGLDILSRVARGALEAVMPPAPPQYGPPMYPGAPFMQPAPWAPPMAPSSGPLTSSYSPDVQQIARQLAQLASREATRKLDAARRVVSTSASAPAPSYPLPPTYTAPTYAPTTPAMAYPSTSRLASRIVPPTGATS